MLPATIAAAIVVELVVVHADGARRANRAALRTAHRPASLSFANSLLTTTELCAEAAKRTPRRSLTKWLRSSSMSLAFSATSTPTSHDSIVAAQAKAHGAHQDRRRRDSCGS